MRTERQIDFLERIAAAGPQMEGLHAPASMVNEAAAYTDPARFDHEIDLLFRRGPLCVALGRELARPGSFVSGTVGRMPVVVVRQPDGSVRAMVNACRHRGAPVVDEVGAGDGLAALTCPYHSWTYELDGSLRARPGSAGAFDDVIADCDLRPLAAVEHLGLVWVQLAGDTGPDPVLDVATIERHLGGASDDLRAFRLDECVPIDSRVRSWKMNWKLVVDTFCESYHIRTLHRTSIAPHYLSYSVASERFGRHTLSVGLRRSVLDELAKPKEEWNLLPHTTIQYVLVPNIVLTHQIDHIELWRLQPLSVGETRVVTSVYAPSEPHSERSRSYFVKNLDVLLGVTESEDFPLMERIQASLAAGSLDALVYGRNEGPLIDFHRSVNALLADDADDAGRSADVTAAP
jgi:phenylpropionate dioxygenase-like ring-hydroxylating dioxygenase large terminal subunit